jgi:RNA polymerase sigma factor (sigma-70 family)
VSPVSVKGADSLRPVDADEECEMASIVELPGLVDRLRNGDETALDPLISYAYCSWRVRIEEDSGPPGSVHESDAGLRHAEDALIFHAHEWLTRNASRAWGKFPNLWGFVEERDVLQEVYIRLDRAFRNTPPKSRDDYYGRSKHLLYQLMVDTYRNHRGRNGRRPRLLTGQGGAEGRSKPLETLMDRSGEPSIQAEWNEFHELARALPESQRKVFYLIFYEYRTRPKAAETLAMSSGEVKRLWKSAVSRLRRAIPACPRDGCVCRKS